MSSLNRRDALILGSGAAAYGFTRTTPVAALLNQTGDEWAKIAAQQFMRLGVTIVKNERDAGSGHRLNEDLIQRHVDWLDEIRDGKPVKTDIRHIEAALGLLAGNVSRSIGPLRDLKTFSMMIPNPDVYSAARLAYGHLRLRFVQSYYRGDIDGLSEEGIINRIDILYPRQGV